MRNGSRAASGLAAGLVLLIAAAGGAQTSEKEKLARELILVAGGADMARQITDMMLASVQTNYASMVEQMIAAQGDLTPEQKQEVRTHLADYDRFASEFSRRVAAEIDYEQIMYEVYVPLYDRYFTEDELRQLLAFQKSPIGQKSIAVTPQLMQEGMAASVPRIQPALIKIVTEVMATQQADALEDVD